MPSTERALPAPQPDSPAFPTLTAEQVERLRAYGHERAVRAGDVLFREGDERYDFVVILDGLVDIVDGLGREPRIVATHGPGRFLGELNLFTGQAVYLSAVTRGDGRVLAVAPERMDEVVSGDQALGNLILQAFLLRRAILQDLGAGLRIIGSRFSPEALALREFAVRNRLPHTWVDLEVEADAEVLLRSLAVEADETPVVLTGASVLRNPTVAQLARAIGLGRPAGEADGEVHDLLVVGAGPAGLAAGVYGASEGLDTLVLDAVAAGGQAGTSTRIENYLGFPAGVSGSDLAQGAVVQAGRLGARIVVPRQAVELRAEDGAYVVRCAGGGDLRGRCLVLATGAQYRRLDVPGLERLEGRGIYYAATPEEARLCGGEEVAIAGAGNSAGQAAVFLAGRARVVHLLVRGEDLARSMSRYLIEQIERSPHIRLWLRTEVAELLGQDDLEGVVVRSRADGTRERLAVAGLFVFIGADPRTSWLEGTVALDRRGFILAGRDLPAEVLADERWARLGRDPFLLETSLPGVFVAGDARSGSVKRVAAAVGDGSLSVRLVHDALAEARVGV